MISEKECENTLSQNSEHTIGVDLSCEEDFESAYLNPDCFSNNRASKVELEQIKAKQQELQKQISQYRIRKLTPTECFKLQGWQDKDIQKVKDIDMTDTQIYRQAGNGIAVPCVELLFEHLYKAQYDENYECYDETFLKASPAEM